MVRKFEQRGSISSDIIIELVDRAEKSIVLIERRNPPYGWALPGGFVDVGESLEQAAVREALEETCLDVNLKILLGCYSSPQRDPRGHTVSPVYIAEAHGEPRAADDAKNLRCVPVNKLPHDLVFDRQRSVYKVQPQVTRPAQRRDTAAKQVLETVHGGHHRHVVSLSRPFITAQHWQGADIALLTACRHDRISEFADVFQPQIHPLPGQRVNDVGSIPHQGDARCHVMYRILAT